ncbi:MAG: hypothetical protein M3P51_09675 [Chloroflexota bacterium]|nr:hypothetical protein [Chloroflexota bacterium]
MGNRKRTRRPSCGVAIGLSLAFGFLTTLAVVAVEWWGVIAFVLILAAILAASFGLLVASRSHLEAERLVAVPPFLIVLPTSVMSQELGMSFWGALFALPASVGLWLFGSRLLPWWESRRGDSHR